MPLPRPRRRPVRTTAFPAVLLAVIAGCAKEPSRQDAGIVASDRPRTPGISHVRPPPDVTDGVLCRPRPGTRGDPSRSGRLHGDIA
jgi:hypothetical protein